MTSFRPKKIGKAVFCNILEWQAHRLRKKHQFTVVAIAGSVGKTSTKLAIAAALGSELRVIYQDGNYNDRLTVPLVLFGRVLPKLSNMAAWLKIFISNERQLRKDYPYDVAVLELGTDGPGQIEKFAYLRPDLLVLTAIAPEHMEFFGTLEAVAREELAALGFSKQALINIDDVPEQFLPSAFFLGYGRRPRADYSIQHRAESTLNGQEVIFKLAGGREMKAYIRFLGEHGAKIILAAAAVADLLKLPVEGIEQAVSNIKPFPGRMQILPGIDDSTIIDDTYNASPAAVKAALDVLYHAEAAQRIAVLGSMNELGKSSPGSHREIGEYCDPEKLQTVVTIGQEAKKYLAPAAKRRGCEVVSFLDPYEAGTFVRTRIGPGSVVLFKGSQNGVFAEEAIKPVLANPDDETRLVRQSTFWMRKKRHTR